MSAIPGDRDRHADDHASAWFARARCGRALVGIITVQDVDRALAEPNVAEVTVGEVCSRDLLVAFPDETVSATLQRMSARDIGRMPVVSRRDPRQLVGLLRRNEMVRAYVRP